MSDADRKAAIKKTNGIFQLNVKPASGDVKTWTIDLKKDGEVVKGPKGKPGASCLPSGDVYTLEARLTIAWVVLLPSKIHADVTINLDDSTFAGLVGLPIPCPFLFLNAERPSLFCRPMAR